MAGPSLELVLHAIVSAHLKERAREMGLRLRYVEGDRRVVMDGTRPVHMGDPVYSGTRLVAFTGTGHRTLFWRDP